jgi:hypothetical protein
MTSRSWSCSSDDPAPTSHRLLSVTSAQPPGYLVRKGHARYTRRGRGMTSRLRLEVYLAAAGHAPAQGVD